MEKLRTMQDEQKYQTIQAESSETYSFKPTINKQEGKRRTKKEFLQQMEAYQQRKKNQIENMQKKIAQETYSGRPQVQTSEKIRGEKPVFDRLYQKAKAQKQNLENKR